MDQRSVPAESQTTAITDAVIRRLVPNQSSQSGIRIEPIRGGRNNRVFKVVLGKEAYCVKSYFTHKEDTRNRLDSEFAFLSFASEWGVRTIPRPIACDREHSIGVYEFVRGERIEANQATEDLVDQAMEFYLAINSHRMKPGAVAIPNASEACFTLSGHINCVDRRIERLRTESSKPFFDRCAAKFITGELVPAWERLKLQFRSQCLDSCVSMEDELQVTERCLSPSDFGFHNALTREGGRLCFVDFEYAGWDDPAKMVCDFFRQPAVPVPDRYQSTMLERISAQDQAAGEAVQFRVLVLSPVYSVKWCCILLNDFLSVGDKRRTFARAPEAQEGTKRKQLDMAREMLARV